MSYKKENSGKMIIVSAPSGAGKTTLVRYLLAEMNSLEFSVSCTTRDKRDYEIDGKDYYFISVSDFQEKIKEKAFVEFEEVYEGLFYGTLHTEITRIWAANKTIIFDIDVEGGLNIKKQYPEALALFIAPPKQEVLAERLEARNTESSETLQMRVSKSIQELQYQEKFDRTIVNDVLEDAQKEISEVVSAFISSNS